ncbi:hypothetical protein PULV_b0573 [Pseudoalteromonas ulvae UL12]|nr:hypothetical protein [Pseudoalteromonas ulvae UL12]
MRVNKRCTLPVRYPYFCYLQLHVERYRYCMLVDGAKRETL